MKTLKANLKQKSLLIGLLFICSNISGQTILMGLIDMNSILNSNIHYTIQYPDTAKGGKTTFIFSGNGLKDILRGQAYFVVSKSKNINSTNYCFRNTIANRFYPGNPTRNTWLERDNYLNFEGVSRVNTSTTTTRKYMNTNKRSKIKDGTYYHYVILYVYVHSTKKWQHIIITEKNRTTFTIGKASLPEPDPDPEPEPEPEPTPEANIDIAFTNFSIYNSVNYPSNTITATVKARNIGNTNIENVTGKFYISNKSTYENNYNTINCNSQSLGNLSVGEERTYSVNINLPSEGVLNSYFPNQTNLYLLGYLESVINEKNTKDNSKAISITIIH